MDEDEDDFYTDDEDGALSSEFFENVQEVIRRLFERDEQTVNKQLQNFKKYFRMKFASQPDYFYRDDIDSENSNNKDIQAQ